MQFILSDPQAASAALLDRLRAELAQRKVLWLVSGGSNTNATIEIMRALPAELTSRLAILPVDERFGPPGHADSNWQQLLDEGFDGKQARLWPLLQPRQSLAGAREYYEELARQAISETDTCIAQLGMGADGHIAGILPHSPAVAEKALVSAYDSSPYQRLTLTFTALQRITVAYTFAFGEAKRPALEILQSNDLPLDEQPAQFLKQIQESYLYNDQLGEKQ